MQKRRLLKKPLNNPVTTVEWLRQEGRLCGYRMTGHSTEHAEDQEGKLCCAFISSAAYLIANLLEEVLHIPLQVYESDGEMEIRCLEICQEGVHALQGLVLHLEQLAQMYPQRIEIIDGEKPQE